MGGTIELPFGLATSIGPVPCDTPQDASDVAFAANPSFPTVPVLSAHPSSLLAQAVHGIDGVEVLPPGLLRLRDTAAVGEPDEVSVEGEPFAATTDFLGRLAGGGNDGSLVGVRVGLLGPVTLALSLRAAGVPTHEALELADRLVARRAAALLAATRAALPDAVVMVCASEPGLVGAMHPTFPLAPSEVASALGTFVTTLDRHVDAGSLLIGVHVPGRTNWETILSTGVSVVSAPADSAVVGWSAALADFLDRGGRIAWGAVPVDQPLGTSEELLWRRLSALWCELVGAGMDPLLLRSRSLISPVDGLGHFGPTQAERLLELVDSISLRVRRQAIGARLSLGA